MEDKTQSQSSRLTSYLPILGWLPQYNRSWLRTGIIPRWMAFLGLILAVFLLLSIGLFSWASLILPLWVLLISVHILIANMGRPTDEPVI